MTIKILFMKKYSFALIAVVFALASAFAFKPTFSSFTFNGVSTDWEDRVDQNEYTLTTPSCGSTENVLCGIVSAADGNNKPVILPTTSDLYIALKNGGVSTPNFTPAEVVGKQ